MIMEMQNINFLDTFPTYQCLCVNSPRRLVFRHQNPRPHYINTKANLEYVGPLPDILYFGAGEMS
jgi:hypothetical protein